VVASARPITAPEQTTSVPPGESKAAGYGGRTNAAASNKTRPWTACTNWPPFANHTGAATTCATGAASSAPKAIGGARHEVVIANAYFCQWRCATAR
jgi:hypothetical protein